MNDQQRQIRDQQRDAWNTFSAGWRKWDALTMEFLAPAGDAIIGALEPLGEHRILDVAAGTGEPGLSIAQRAPGAHVLITDLSEDMLAIARDHAAARGITNVATQVCDVSELPFADASFDRISCRFGFMFFPDMELAASELVRVLRPGGRLATSVWGPASQNAWVTSIMRSIDRHIERPTPPPGSPGMFRCAEHGLMVSILERAGLTNVVQQEVQSTLNCGTVDVYWQMMNDVAAPVVAALRQTDDATRDRIRNEVDEAIRSHYDDGHVMLEASALVISGIK